MLARSDTNSPLDVVAPALKASALRATPGKRRRLYLGLGLAVLISSLLWARSRSAVQRIAYETASVTLGTISARVTANGTLSARVTVQVGSQVSGRIQRLFADFNSKVERGQVLAVLDPELFRAAVDAARAGLIASQGSLSKAKARAVNLLRVAKRTQALVDHDLVARADLEAAEADAGMAAAEVAGARGAVAQARATLRQATANLAYATIKSPVDGVVISRSVDVGQTVAASLQAPTLFTLAEDLTKMQVHTNVPEADIGRLRAGMPAIFTVDAYPEQDFHGTVQAVRNASQVTQNVVTYDAVVDVDNKDLSLRPGMTATVNFVLAERRGVLTVPLAALRFQPRNRDGDKGGAERDESGPAEFGDTPRVYKASRSNSGKGKNVDSHTIYVLSGGRARAVDVRLGLSDATAAEIFGPVQEGDAVVVAERDRDAARPRKASRLPRGP
ncbi:MAG: efflux RND transporter periplasmic adaptor subunit [Myxococcales bacterium]